jgi:hypothetical protein
MVQPPRPGAQCRHHTPAGLSSSSTRASLQHNEHWPQVRAGELSGILVSLLMTITDLSHDVWRRHGAILAVPPLRSLAAGSALHLWSIRSILWDQGQMPDRFCRAGRTFKKSVRPKLRTPVSVDHQEEEIQWQG